MTGKDKVKDIEFENYLKKLKGLLKPGDMGDERDSGSSEELDPDRIYRCACFGQPKNASCF